MSDLKAMYTSNSDEWATPQAFFDELNNEFNFTLDACATEDNHKCRKYYTKEQDGLKFSWGGVARVVQSTVFRDYKVG